MDKKLSYRDSAGKFAPGNPGKPQGAVDRTRRARTVAFDFVHRYFSTGQAADDWEGLEPGQRWNIITRLLGVITPKESRIDLRGLASGDIDALAVSLADLLETENTNGHEEE